MSEDTLHLIEMTTDIVSAYVGQHTVNPAELPKLINQVHATLALISGGALATPEAAKPEPAVPLRKAVQPDFVVDLFTGRKLKSLKRHLRSTHNMTPEQYRAYWGLPKDSPMVAPNYAKSRSELAKTMGLGQKGRPTAA